MKLVLLCLVAFATVYSAPVDLDGVLDPEAFANFLTFQQEFDVQCIQGSEDCLKKKHNFNINLKELREQAQTVDHKVGFTKFMTWSKEERKAMLMDIEKFPHSGLPYDHEQAAAVRADVGSLDWRSTGAVNPIKDQGQCGCCWAFAAVGSMEIQSNYVNNRINSNRRNYAEQWLVDCSQAKPCDGGWPSDALKYIQSNGIPLTSKLPYHAKQETCPKSIAVDKPVTGQTALTGKPSDMLNFVKSTGPVAACFYVCSDFMNYKSGVYSTNCNAKSKTFEGGHAITIIGYGTTNGVDYWLARNQWGTGWGISGYFMIKRGADTSSIESYQVIAPKVGKIAL